MIEAYKKMFVNYANFNDRTSRRDYWLCVLMNVIINFVLSFILGFLSGLLNEQWPIYISVVYLLIILIPSIAMVVRRMHDINKSGWWCFITFVPVVGSLILLIFECLPSVTENNNYGVQL